MDPLTIILIAILWFICGLYAVSLMHSESREEFPNVTKENIFSEWISDRWSILAFTVWLIGGPLALIIGIVLTERIRP